MEPMNGMIDVSTLHLATNCRPIYYYSLKKKRCDTNRNGKNMIYTGTVRSVYRTGVSLLSREGFLYI